MAWRRASIVGAGATRQGKLPDETPLSLAAEAFRLALADSGIDKNEVDGLLTMPGTTSPEGSKNYLTVGELLGSLPGFDLFRVPARWLALFALGASLLAALGVEWLIKEAHSRAPHICFTRRIRV